MAKPPAVPTTGINYSLEEWHKEGIRRFGDNFANWKFICPMCGNIASIADVVKVGGTPDDATNKCIGRWINVHTRVFVDHPIVPPCDYHGASLFQISPNRVNGTICFQFAEPDDIQSLSLGIFSPPYEIVEQPAEPCPSLQILDANKSVIFRLTQYSSNKADYENKVNFLKMAVQKINGS